MKVDTFFKQIFLPVWGNRSTQRKPTTFGSGLTHFNNPTRILQREIRFLTFTSLKYLSCFLCYLGIYRKPVIREIYSAIMKWTTIWQFPLLAGHCHSTSNTCNNCTYMLQDNFGGTGRNDFGSNDQLCMGILRITNYLKNVLICLQQPRRVIGYKGTKGDNPSQKGRGRRQPIHLWFFIAIKILSKRT
jgi:hypothetical protein